MSTVTMVTTATRAAATAAIAGLTGLVLLPVASVAADDHFVDVERTTWKNAQVSVTPTSPGDPGGGSGAVTAARDGSRGDRMCLDGGTPIACTRGDAWWSSHHACYLTDLGTTAPGAIEGVGAVVDAAPGTRLFHCTPATPGGTGRLLSLPDGADPAAAGLAVDPEVLARSAVERMALRAIDIGIVPEPDDPASIGLVGLPVWMWVEEPSPTTWGPVTATATAAATTVSATARVTEVEWNMGDGTFVTCTSPGTAYQDSAGNTMSPDCGHRYTRTSVHEPAQAYLVSAISHWQVTWTASTGASGTIPLTLTSSAQVRVGELQVLVQDPGT
jgi:hypothetical protein